MNFGALFSFFPSDQRQNTLFMLAAFVGRAFLRIAEGFSAILQAKAHFTCIFSMFYVTICTYT